MSQSFESVKEYLPYFFDVTTNYYYRNSDNREKILSGGNEMRPSVKEGKYKRIVITRNVQPVGKDIGFLPGTLEEKMRPWLMPIQDNLEFLRIA